MVTGLCRLPGGVCTALGDRHRPITQGSTPSSWRPVCAGYREECVCTPLGDRHRPITKRSGDRSVPVTERSGDRHRPITKRRGDRSVQVTKRSAYRHRPMITRSEYGSFRGVYALFSMTGTVPAIERSVLTPCDGRYCTSHQRCVILLLMAGRFPSNYPQQSFLHVRLCRV